MQKQKLVLVYDCGATNVRAVAINERGEIAAMHAIKNNTRPDPNYPAGLIWDVEEIWEKFSTCTKAISQKIDLADISAVTVTTFGVNGAPVDTSGKLLYPVISWQCQRTVPFMESVEKFISTQKLYELSGINQYSFNTVYTLLWLKEHRPEVLDSMAGFLFIPSLFIQKLTGELINDRTMSGTSMLTNAKERSFSNEILNAIDVPNRFFSIGETGEVAGEVTQAASDLLGIPKGTPVVLGGHDTQLALIGSGAGENEAVLSSGTWEILMNRTRHVTLNDTTFKAGFTNELDAVKGLYNSGIQWLASGVLEWVKNAFYAHEVAVKPNEVYDIMISAAEKINLTGKKLNFNPEFVSEDGALFGIGLQTSRDEIYRAALESLVVKTKNNLQLLEEAGKFKAESLIVVGGGTKNRLWNQLRADYLGIPIKLSNQSETTVLGASLFAHKAIGTFTSVEQAVEANCRSYNFVYPK